MMNRPAPLPLAFAKPAGAPHRARLFALAGLALWAALSGAVTAAAQGVASKTMPAVVVWDFDNQTPGAAQPASTTEFLRRSLSENLTATLLQVAGLPVVERQRLRDLLAEQKLAAGALADEDTRLRLGKIIGAPRMVFGGFFVLGDEVQVHVRLVDTASSRVLFSDETVTPLASVMQQTEALNRRLAQALGAAGSRPLGSHPPALWQAYDNALALADAGQIDAAVQALQTLLGKAKDFAPAERELIALLDKMARR
jgi:TolB-like protein